MKEVINKIEPLPEYIVNDEFSKEFEIKKIEENFEHLSGKFLLVYGTKDDIDHMESAFEGEGDAEVIRSDGSKMKKPNKEGFFDPVLDWKGRFLFVPKNIKMEIVDDGDHFVVKCHV